MKKHLKLLVYSVLVALTFASPQALQGMETEFADQFPFEKCPKDLKLHIVKFSAIDHCLSKGNPGNLGVVCKEWQRIINDESVKESCRIACLSFVVRGHEEVYQRFLRAY